MGGEDVSYFTFPLLFLVNSFTGRRQPLLFESVESVQSAVKFSFSNLIQVAGGGKILVSGARRTSRPDRTPDLRDPQDGSDADWSDSRCEG
jgi:hypothetical protein